MPVPSSINDLDVISTNNFPQATDAVGATLYLMHQAHSAIIKKQAVKGAGLTVLASGVLTVPVDEGFYDVSGTGFNITGLSSAFAGRTVKLKFLSAGLVLVNSASFKLPGNVNYTTKAGDIIEFVADTTSIWIASPPAVYANGDVTINGILFMPGASAGVEIGRTDGVAGTPNIDFHSGATAVDFDSRIIASGGTGVGGGGTLTVIAGSFLYGANKVDAFPAGTRIVFYQAAAPTGWTNIGLGANFALVTGTGGTVGGGGGVGYNLVTGCTVVASHTHTQQGTFTSGNSNVSLSHTHGYNAPSVVGTGPGLTAASGSVSVANTVAADLTAHTHNVTISGATSTNTNLDVWAPQYVTIIVCSKN